jgi:hemerythrin superfamily protein
LLAPGFLLGMKAARPLQRWRLTIAVRRPQMKATQLLKSQHREAAKIFSELEKGRTAKAAERVQSLVTKLGAHMVIEQELFYPTVKTIKPALVLESFEEHAGAQAMMERLLLTEPEDESFKARLTTLKEMIQHHVEEEESDLFPAVERKVKPQELSALGERMKARFDELVSADDLRQTLDRAEQEQPMPVHFEGVPLQ